MFSPLPGVIFEDDRNGVVYLLVRVKTAVNRIRWLVFWLASNTAELTLGLLANQSLRRGRKKISKFRQSFSLFASYYNRSGYCEEP